MKRRDSGNDISERRKCMEQKLSQSENRETGEAFQVNNHPPNPFDILDALLMEYLEENKKENQSHVTVNSMSLPSSSLMHINGEHKIDEKVNTCFPKEFNSREQKTKKLWRPWAQLAENTRRSGTLQSAIPEPCCLLLSGNPLQSSMTSLFEVPEDQTRKEEAELKGRNKEPKDKPADGTPVLGTSNSSLFKKIFESLGDSSKFDALMRGEFVLDVNDTDFLPDSPALNRPTNEGDEQNAKNVKEMKGRHKFSEYQVEILKEHFHINEYIKLDEVQALSKALRLTPQQIKDWFHNQRSKRKKCAGPLKESSNIQAAVGVPTRNTNNFSPWKGIFQNVEGLDALRQGEVILNPEESDFLPQTSALNRTKNEDEEKKAENTEASDNQNGKKIRHRFSGHQLQILSEYFHRNEYIKTDEVQVLSKALRLTPQQIKDWFYNQRSKRKKRACPLKEASNIQAAVGVPTRNMNNFSPWKGIFQNVEGLDALRQGEVILNPEESDFLPQTPALNRSKNEDEEKKAENTEASDNQNGKKVQHSLSRHQLQILREYFHRYEYIRPYEVQVLSKALSLTPKQIRQWFRNQRAKKKKFEGSFNRTWNMNFLI